MLKLLAGIPRSCMLPFCSLVMAAEKKHFSLEEVNCMDYTDFIIAFGSVIEHCTLAAASVWESRPFSSTEDLHQALKLFLESLPPKLKLAQVRCYPDLAGTLTKKGELSVESRSEQKGAGLLDLSPSETETLSALNSRYREKFRFPFVVCARENKKQAIMEGISARLGNDVAVEMERALEEITKIAFYRLKDMIVGDLKNK